MGILTFMMGKGINDAIKEYENTKGAVLLDVRNVSEFEGGHIPGAINIPLEALKERAKELKDKNAPIYAYCLSGARSGSAISILKSLGFNNVNNIGGINAYKGPVEKSKGRSF